MTKILSGYNDAISIGVRMKTIVLTVI